MKLYTEEQVRDAIKNRFTARYTKENVKYYLNTDQVIEELTPIELPSDDEIKEMRKPYIKHINTMVHADLERDGYLAVGFIAGAEYVINKIQGGNK